MASVAPITFEVSLSLFRIGTAVSGVFLAAALWFLFADPLRHIPGPFIARLTPLWFWWLSWTGVECRVIDALHNKYGPVVRIAPNEIDISDGAALNTIYVKNGGYLKSPIYRNYDVNGFETIFSVLDPVHRASRAKAVAPMFSQQNIAKNRPVMQNIIDHMVVELQRRRAESQGDPTDVLNICRALALDLATMYLFGECFNGMSQSKLSATDFIDNSVSSGRFFHLPGWIYDFIDKWASRLDKNKVHIQKSTSIIQEYATRVVDRDIAGENGGAQRYLEGNRSNGSHWSNCRCGA